MTKAGRIGYIEPGQHCVVKSAHFIKVTCSTYPIGSGDSGEESYGKDVLTV